MQATPSSRLLLDASILLLAAASAYCSSDPALWRLFIAATWGWTLLLLVRWKTFGYTAREVIVFALLFRFLFLLTPPILSDDYYRYLWDGMLQHHGINPFHHRPRDGFLAQFHAHPLFDRLNSAEFFSVYPPVPQGVFAIATFGMGEDYTLNLLVLRALLAGAEFGAVVLLVKTVDARAAALYALHPLAAIELAGELHMEALLVLFLAATFWAWRRGYHRTSVAAIVLAGLTKLYPLVLLPFIIRRVGWRKSVPGLVLGVFLALPYVDAAAAANLWQSLDLYVRFFEFNAGLYYGLKGILALITGEDFSKVLGPLFRWLFVALVAVVWWKDRRTSFHFPDVVFYLFAAFFLLSTTIHPWYLTAVLVVTPFLNRPAWAWLFLSAASIASYERYIDRYYWAAVVVTWTGFALVALITNRNRLLDRLQQHRARKKADRIIRWLHPAENIRLIDIGAGEGFVGAEIKSRLQAEVALVDVIDMNRTELPLTIYDGLSIPFPNDSFDHALLVFVLHHCEDAERVLAEAARVTRGRIVILESVYASEFQRKLLSFLDRRANRIRSKGLMRGQEEHVHFRTAAEWRRMIKSAGLDVVVERRWGNVVHLQHLFVLEISKSPDVRDSRRHVGGD